MENDYDELYDNVTRRVERCDKEEYTRRGKRLATPCAKLLKGFIERIYSNCFMKKRFVD